MFERIKLFPSNLIETQNKIQVDLRNIKHTTSNKGKIHNVWHPDKDYQAYRGKKTWPILKRISNQLKLPRTDTEILDKDIKRIIKTAFYMFKS